MFFYVYVVKWKTKAKYIVGTVSNSYAKGKIIERGKIVTYDKHTSYFTFVALYMHLKKVMGFK
jgi:hypothetical protein